MGPVRLWVKTTIMIKLYLGEPGSNPVGPTVLYKLTIGGLFYLEN